MAQFRLTRLAEDDLSDIARFTRRSFGERQRDRYLERLERRFAQLAERPNMGPAREDIAAGCRSYFEASHIILYQIAPDGIVILRVLHAARDLRRVTGLDPEC